MNPIQVDSGKCTGCGTCSDICPGDVIHMDNNKPIVRYPDHCWYCGSCAKDCPNQAITIQFPYLIR